MYACEAYFEEAVRDSGLGSRWRYTGRAGVRDILGAYAGAVAGGVECEAALEEFVACVMERMRVYARAESAGVGLNWETPSGVQSAQLGQ